MTTQPTDEGPAMARFAYYGIIAPGDEPGIEEEGQGEMNRTEELNRASKNITLCQEKVRILMERGLNSRNEDVKYWRERLKTWTNYRAELAGLECQTCYTVEIVLGKTVMGSGEFHIKAVCPHCGFNLKGSGQWISKKVVPAEILEALPIFDDYSVQLPGCEVCGERGVQLHHWAPKELFPETFEEWPTSYLCKKHHTEWHDIVTNPYRQLRKRQEKANGVPSS